MPDVVDSYYEASVVDPRRRPALAGSLRTQVCIIGAGLTGVSTALHLARRGIEAVVLEAETVGWGASGRNGGQVGTGQRVDQQTLTERVGQFRANDLWQLSLAAVALVESLAEQFKIDCDLKRGILHLAAKRTHVAQMRKEVDYLRKHHGYQAIRFADRLETAEMVGSDRFHGAQVDSGSLHLHPLNFVRGLADAAEGLGATIHERSRVEGVNDRAACVEITTADGQVRANHVVYACNGYLDTLNDQLAQFIMPINNFLLATEPLSDDLAKRLIRDDFACQDTLFVINYWKLSGDNRLLFGGGENYRRRFPRDLKKFVRKYLLRIYPQLAEVKIDHAWGGTLAITLNRLPSVGRLGQRSYYAQGYSGHGVPTATMAGKLIADAIVGDTDGFDLIAGLPIHRFPGGTLLRWPALVAGMSYYALRDRLG